MVDDPRLDKLEQMIAAAVRSTDLAAQEVATFTRSNVAEIESLTAAYQAAAEIFISADRENRSAMMIVAATFACQAGIDRAALRETLDGMAEQDIRAGKTIPQILQEIRSIIAPGAAAGSGRRPSKSNSEK